MDGESEMGQILEIECLEYNGIVAMEMAENDRRRLMWEEFSAREILLQEQAEFLEQNKEYFHQEPKDGMGNMEIVPDEFPDQ